MKIIIAGAGRIGRALAEVLCSEGHDVTVIDKDAETISFVSNNMDAICIEGGATSADVLLSAGAAKADLLLATTEQDEVNLVCGITAKKLGTEHVIARVRDPEYMGKTAFLRDAFGISVIINPEYECATEISRILRFPGAARVDSFSNGRVEIVEYKVPAGGKLDDVAVTSLQKLTGAKVLVCLAERDGQAIIPNGSYVLKAEDRLSITGSPKELRKFFISAGAYKKSVKSAVIMGGSTTAVYLTRILNDSGIDVTVIEDDRERCDQLCQLVPYARIVCGDATHSDVLSEEGIQTTDAFAAMTKEDGDNIITSIYAKHCGVGKIVTIVNHEHFAEVMDSSDLDSVVTPKTIVVNQIVRYVRAMDASAGSSMETLYKLADGRAEAMEFKITDAAGCTGAPLKDLKLKPNVLISALIRDGRIILPDGSTELSPGDHAVVVAEAGRVKNIDDIILK